MRRVSRPAGVAILVAAVVAAVAAFLLLGGDGDEISTSPTTTTSVAISSTGATTTSTVAATTPETVVVGPSSTTATTAPGAPEVAALKLDLHGLGPVRVGMTVPQAQAALGRGLRALGDASGECTLYAPEGGPEGVAFMVTGGTVARVDVIGGPVTSVQGLAIGLTETRAQQLFGNGLRVSPHSYTEGGHYLTLVPTTPADANFRLVAETDGTTVTSFRAGRLPEVEFPEGCS